MSDGFCDVDIDADCDESCEVWRLENRTARKPHKCDECHGDIVVGERYELTVSLYDGRWDRFKTCLACGEIAQEFMTGWRVSGILWAEFDELWNQGANVQGCMNRVSTVAAKQKLLDKWRKWKGVEA